MNCYLHNEKKEVSKCNICQKPLCEDCANFCEEHGACPTCLKKQVQNMYQSSKRGIWYTITSMLCAVVFLTLYVIDLSLGKLEKSFVIIGAIILGILLPLTIFLLIHSLKKRNEYKKFLENNIKNNENQ